MDVCGGGTISVGATSITFENHHDQTCTLADCTMSGWPTTDPVVPAKNGATPGTLTVQLSSSAVAGDYTYTPSCCNKRGAPVIKVQ
jgi:hypothetical protein